MARTAQPLDPRREEALLEAAAEEFTRCGYDQASLNRIIATAGWAKSSFYHYFPDKQRLHDHVVTTLRDHVEGDLDVPDLDLIRADTYWPAMVGLLTSLSESTAKRPDLRLLSLMFHQPSAARGPDGQLMLLRTQVTTWSRRAAGRGQTLRVIRPDIPFDLVADLAISTVAATDRWNLEHAAANGGRPAPTLTPTAVVELVRSLVGYPIE